MVTQSQYRQILDSLLMAIIVLDTRLRVTFVSTAAEMLLGLSEDQIIGREITQCFECSKDFVAILKESVEQERQFTFRHARWHLHNGSDITVDFTVSPNLEAGMVVMEVQGLDRLIKINREEAMLSTQETSRNLVRSMAHEIKNPLSGIRGAAQLLAREFKTSLDNELTEYTQIIIAEADRLRNLVDRMLGPHKPIQFLQVNLHEVLEHIMKVLSAETDRPKLFVRDYDPSIPEVPGDRELLIQAVLNIARNAVQALQESDRWENGKIIFKTRVHRRYTIGRKQHALVAKMSIIDNGPGIPADFIEDVFFPMITGRAEGTGLGLAIAQNLVGQHKGFIECTSEPGATEFSIYLPLEE